MIKSLDRYCMISVFNKDKKDLILKKDLFHTQMHVNDSFDASKFYLNILNSFASSGSISYFDKSSFEHP